jgi:hypothetical protein
MFEVVPPHLFLVLVHQCESFLGSPYDCHGRGMFDFDSTEQVVQFGFGYPKGRGSGSIRSFCGLVSR